MGSTNSKAEDLLLQLDGTELDSIENRELVLGALSQITRDEAEELRYEIADLVYIQANGKLTEDQQDFIHFLTE